MFATYLIDMNFTKRIFSAILITTILITAYTSCNAQDNQSLGNWNSVLVKGKLSPKWSLLGESHIRSSNYDFKYDYFEHRVRLEQRFIGDKYKNRLKYRLGLLVPINKTEMVHGSIYLALSDELFMPQYGPVVEKNRFYLGAGFKMNKNAALQIGCINDNDYKPNIHTTKNFLQIMLIYDFTN